MMTPHETDAIDTLGVGETKTDQARRLSAAIEADYPYVSTTVWAKGGQVRLYIRDRKRGDKGYVDLTGSGPIDHTRGLSAVIVRARHAAAL